jgi:uncharacterized phage protein (TIGR02218 family)
MRNISPKLANHLLSEITTLATCWVVTRKDGRCYRFTDHHSSIICEGFLYSSRSGFNSTALASSADLAIDNIDIEGIIDSDYITKDDVLAGLYDGAMLEVFVVNYQDPSIGKIILSKGIMGEVKLHNHKFIVEVRGISQKATAIIGELYSANCRAKLGDTRCKIDINKYAHEGKVTTIMNNNSFADDKIAKYPDGYFNYGTVRFLTGDYAGNSLEVRMHNGKVISVLGILPPQIKPGDQYKVVAGCDKTFASCCNKYYNALNFRGEPHVPGNNGIVL